MSEINTNPTQETPAVSESALSLAIESVMDEIDLISGFPAITRGALGTGDGLACEIAPSYSATTFMDKNTYNPVTLALNGKHQDLRLLSDTLNKILDSMTRRTTYPSGNGWEIVDIAAGILPRIIGREENNAYLMACDLVIKVYRKDDEAE